ncbi:hypothetical protein HX014_15735 [Myroides marinus]|uniref:hypothetical protein n=1 Tax=Myroides marinus TaxID=703342 RepID=UPI0025775737|nr:hypothetical protein [Myroides marinus]MDM1352065.1 hypothetical protein [Myroides marinus]MDM1359249.1 hypothetical protein [Myroides marinus]
MKGKFAECIPYSEMIKGRIGGNPPIEVEDKIPENYLFYATLVHPDKENSMLSILIHQDFEVLIEKNIYPNIEIKVIEHQYANESLSNKFCIKELGIASITEYKEDTKNDDDTIFVQYQGQPRLIQSKSRYYEQLNKAGYEFFISILEEGYDFDTMDVVFNFGALYLYKHNETGEVIAGYWQYS